MEDPLALLYEITTPIIKNAKKIRVLKLFFSLFFTFTKAFSFFILVKKVKNVIHKKMKNISL